MTRGSLRFTEAEYKAYAAKAGFKVGTHHSPAALDPPALTPPLATGDGGAPHTELDDALMEAARIFSGKPSKYRNKPTNGYASIREAKRAFELKLMQEAGQIRNLREQVSFLLIPKQEGERACSYVADFCYDEWAVVDLVGNDGWHPTVEDCKGMRTDIYRLKRKLMLFVHKIRIRET
jgi:hypothetical protein